MFVCLFIMFSLLPIGRWHMCYGSGLSIIIIIIIILLPIRLSRYGLERDHSLLDLMQSTLASFLSSHPKCLRLWQM